MQNAVISVGRRYIGLEPVADKLADFANGVEAQIGNLMFLEADPDRLNRIEFGA